MAFLRTKQIGKIEYYYIVENRRRGAKTIQKTLEYLGRDPSPARLRRALTYWRVKEKPAKARRRKR